ncbi:isochorismate synthase [Azospirillum doebereinerae]|uniref:isochorismate synthase n=1 Tax=Azospirillum doebereinerae TaxID=92933 RepID=A0A3S1CFJ1_9PROT|nr:isochorismate synthase [Azospirillum doebereinerae]RUQ67817.1 isochorismate synthase [Azospirillum doebereinerae]
MDVISPSAGDFPSDGDSPDPDFVFSSQGKVLKSFGIAERLPVALNSPDFTGGAWDERLRNAFRALKAKGVDNPIVVGAVPFDSRQPAQLFIPRRYEIADAARFVRDAGDDGAALEVAGIHETINRRHYESAVGQALDLFRTTALKKVVLSRPLDIEARRLFAPQSLAHALLRQNPGAFVFSVPVAYGQTLIGASPELLIRKTGRNIVSNPLAGSARRSPSREEEERRVKALLGSQKDKTEHRYVVDAVREALSGHCATLSVPEGPSVIRTPTMLHLSTEIAGELADPSVSSLRLAHALHPTPAICGTPTDPAFDAIGRLEGYARNWYGGMVGWMDSQGNGEWALSIRCGLASGRNLRLYAGAGVVADSKPAAEWEETAAKLTTMLNAFGLSAAVATAGSGMAGSEMAGLEMAS